MAFSPSLYRGENQSSERSRAGPGFELDLLILKLAFLLFEHHHCEDLSFDWKENTNIWGQVFRTKCTGKDPHPACILLPACFSWHFLYFCSLGDPVSLNRALGLCSFQIRIHCSFLSNTLLPLVYTDLMGQGFFCCLTQG